MKEKGKKEKLLCGYHLTQFNDDKKTDHMEN